MTRRRFYAPPDSFSDDGAHVRLGSEETRHLRNVLRLQTGAEVFVFDGEGREFHGRVQDVSRDSASIEIISPVEAARPESTLNLTLAVAVLKGEKFDLVIQKATELGVMQIVPLLTSRGDVRIRSVDDAERKTVRWQRIALEATKQCGRARLMRMETPIGVEQLIQRSTAADLRIMFSERDGSSLDALTGTAANPTALIGPEGGWEDEEIELVRSAGWEVVTLGGRVLRAETAAIAAAALLQNRFGDLK